MLLRHTVHLTRVRPLLGARGGRSCFAVTFPARDAPTAKLYWQHCGEIVSSRLADEVARHRNMDGAVR